MIEPLPRCERFRIERRQGCARSLNWALTWRVPPPDAEAFSEELLSRGFQARSTVPGLFHGEDPETGEQVLLVLRNSRVELRIPYTTPPPLRPRAAAALAHRVARAAGSTRGEEDHR